MSLTRGDCLIVCPPTKF